MARLYVIFSCILMVTVLAYSQPIQSVPESWFQRDAFFEDANDLVGDASARQDLEEAPTNEHHRGRVQIKVYRGPDNEHENFAPFGYWVKQPADDRRR